MDDFKSMYLNDVALAQGHVCFYNIN